MILSRLLCILLFLLIAMPLNADVVSEEVEYRGGGAEMIGYLAYDDSIRGPRPGVLVVHEWWGLNDYARSRARQLAELGYTAFAVDMYGQGKQAEHPEQAGALAKQVNQRWEDAQQRFASALELLKQHETTDPNRIAAIGYCFGGGIVLNMAREGFDLEGVVSFHGSLSGQREASPGEVEASVLVLHGGADEFVSAEAVETFKQEMEEADVDYRFVSYPGASHGFTNPNADEFGKRFDIPLAYAADADRASWQEMQEFFDRIFDR